MTDGHENMGGHPAPKTPHGRHSPLPPLGTALVVCAHPDDESFGLGAIIDAFTREEAAVAVLCFTRGEGSTLHATPGELRETRARELFAAGEVLGVTRVELLSYEDGRLTEQPISELAAHVTEFATSFGAEALFVFDDGGITGHPDHQRATDAGLAAAQGLDIPVLAWTLPREVAEKLNGEFGASFEGRDQTEVDYIVRVDRGRQSEAIACHQSQAVDNPVLWRRLELQGDTEWLRWISKSGAVRSPS